MIHDVKWWQKQQGLWATFNNVQYGIIAERGARGKRKKEKNIVGSTIREAEKEKKYRENQYGYRIKFAQRNSLIVYYKYKV